MACTRPLFGCQYWVGKAVEPVCSIKVHSSVESLALEADSLEDFMLQALATLEGDEAIEFVMGRNGSCRAWHAPLVGRLKLNVDTAFFADSEEMGFGMVIQDSNRAHIFSPTLAMTGLYTPGEGEAIGLFEALSWIKELDIRNVDVEMDANVVVNAFNSPVSTSISVFGDSVQACKNIFTIYPHCKVVWVNRQANELAHNLARAARDFPSPFVWSELPFVVECRQYTSCSC
ncbi:hypothetical protein ACS0TY_007863 [Phlomoides rotata]